MGRQQGFRYSGGFWAPVVNADKQAYREGWDRVFGPKPCAEPSLPDASTLAMPPILFKYDSQSDRNFAHGYDAVFGKDDDD